MTLRVCGHTATVPEHPPQNRTVIGCFYLPIIRPKSSSNFEPRGIVLYNRAALGVQCATIDETFGSESCLTLVIFSDENGLLIFRSASPGEHLTAFVFVGSLIDA